MTTMRSVVTNTVGEPAEVLHLQTRPIPEPGPDQVRIRVSAAPVEASDLHTIRGRYGFTPEFPTASCHCRRASSTASAEIAEQVNADASGANLCTGRRRRGRSVSRWAPTDTGRRQPRSAVGW